MLDALKSLAELFKLLEKDDANRYLLMSYYVETLPSIGSDKSLINMDYSLSYCHD